MTPGRTAVGLDPSPREPTCADPAVASASSADRGRSLRAPGSSGNLLAVPAGVVVLTDRRVARRPLPEVVAGAAAGGVRWVVLREKDLPRAERLALATELRAILAEVGGTLVVAGPDPLDGDAVHLPAAGPYPPPAVGLVGRSCHDEAELARLTTEHYVTLSPVWPTRTKPGYGPPLHPDGLRKLIGNSSVPVLALGGIETPDQVRRCVESGATGVAVLGALMRSADPAATAAAFTSAFDEAATPVPSRPQPPTATRGQQ